MIACCVLWRPAITSPHALTTDLISLMLLFYAAPPPLVPVNFWALSSGDLVQHTAEHQKLLDDLNESRDDPISVQRCLEAAQGASVSVELSEEPDWWTKTSSRWGTSWRLGTFERHFRLGGQTACVREVGVEDGGLGHCVWDAGIALSIWLSCNAASAVQSRRVLELGSGVGISGISAMLAGASSAVLSDFEPRRDESRASAQEETSLSAAQTQAATLLANLPRNAALSGLSATAVETMGLDWNDCLDASFAEAERFAVVLGSDLIYDVSTAEALCAAVLAHVADGGVFYLMTERDRTGLPELQALLDAAGSLEVDEFTLISDNGATPVVLSTFRPS